MAEEINWSGDVNIVGKPKRIPRVFWRDIGKLVLAFADEFLVLVLVAYIVYRIFW